jgi:hypothetical protein
MEPVGAVVVGATTVPVILGANGERVTLKDGLGAPAAGMLGVGAPLRGDIGEGLGFSEGVLMGRKRVEG